MLLKHKSKKKKMLEKDFEGYGCGWLEKFFEGYKCGW